MRISLLTLLASATLCVAQTNTINPQVKFVIERYSKTTNAIVIYKHQYENLMMERDINVSRRLYAVGSGETGERQLQIILAINQKIELVQSQIVQCTNYKSKLVEFNPWLEPKPKTTYVWGK
jgi:hypothetical protein